MNPNTTPKNSYNVLDRYKHMTVDQIRHSVLSKTFPYAVLMEQWVGDFNISTMIRNANAFGAREVFYVGKRKFDRRGTVGSHHYVNLNHLRAIEDVKKLKEKYHFVCFENNVEKTVMLSDYHWPKMPLMIFGEEGTGITDEMMELADDVVAIQQYGSVRSLNVGTCSGIVMHDFLSRGMKDV